MAAEEGQAGGQGELELAEPQRGLLFTGELVQNATSDFLAKLGELASSVGIETHVVDDVRKLGRVALVGPERDEPLPFTRDDFQAFAAEHGYSASIATRSCAWISRLAREHPRGYHDDLPAIEVIGYGIELRSLYRHVAQNIARHPYQFSPTDKQDKFLLALLNEVVQPDEPLEKPAKESRPRKR